MEDPKPPKFAVVAWAPFFDRGKFMHWVTVGRGETVIGKNGKPRTKFYCHSHASGGSIWTRLLPEGETPEGEPDDEQQQPRRPAHSAGHTADDT
jgi:hypothetical protein